MFNVVNDFFRISLKVFQKLLGPRRNIFRWSEVTRSLETGYKPEYGPYNVIILITGFSDRLGRVKIKDGVFLSRSLDSVIVWFLSFCSVQEF